LNRLLACLVIVPLIATSAAADERDASLQQPAVCRGHLVDITTHRPVAWAYVVLTSADSTFRRMVMSQKGGDFLFAGVPATSFHLVAQHVAYAKFYRELVATAGDTVSVEIELTPAVTTVDSVLVTAPQVPAGGFTGQTPVSLDGRELRRHMDDTIAGTLSDQPGVAERTMGSAPARPVLRGMDSYRVLVLEDGGGVGDVSATSPDHAVTIEPLQAKRVAIVRGPATLMYGPAATAGVVDVRHDFVPDRRLERWSGTAAINAASANQGRATQAALDGPAGPLMLRVDASARTGDDMRTPEGTLGNTNIETYSASAGASIVNDHGYTGLAGGLYRSDYGIPGGFMGGHPNGVDIHIEREHAEARWDQNLAPGGVEHGEAHIGYSRFYQEEKESNDACGVAYGVVTYETNARARFDTGRTGMLTAGAFGEYRDFAQTCFTFLPRTNEYTLAGYAYDEARFGATRMSGALRYDHRFVEPTERDENAAGTIRDRDFGGLSWALAADHTLRRIWNIGATLQRSFRAPSLEELFAEGPHLAAYSYEVGNAELDSERGWTAELRAGLEGARGRATVTAFYSQFDGYIYATDTGELKIGQGSEGELPLYQYVGRDAVLEGGEIEGEWKLSQRVLLHGSLSMVRGTLNDTGDPLPRIPPLAGRLGASYSTGPWRFRAGGRAAAAQERVGEFEEPTEGYVLLDLGIEWTKLTGSFLHSVTLRLDNATDESYRNHLSRTKAIMPEAGRNVSLLYRISFL
jgi:iron complex outermembrane receptor protein